MINMQLHWSKNPQVTQNELRDLGLSMKNFPAEMRAIGKLSEDFFTNAVFSTQGGAIGTSWAPRKDPSGSWPLLQKTGTLRGGWESIAESRSVTIFNPVDYGKYHQTGTKHMVQRKLMAFEGTLPQQIVDLFVKMVEAKIRRALRTG